MTVLELKDAKANLLVENDKVFDLATSENRSLTDAEESAIEINLRKVSELDLRLQSEERKSGLTKGEKRNAEPKKNDFSLMKAIKAEITHQELPEEARNLIVKARNEFRNSGVSPVGSIMIPSAELRADIIAGTDANGGYAVATDKKTILGPLADKLIFTQAGATYLTGLQGDVSVPSYTGTTADWATEVAAVTESNGTFAEVTFSPKRLAAVIDVSKLFLLQESVDAEQLLLSNIQNAVARKLEATILGKATTTATAPGGLAFGITTGVPEAVVTPDRSTIVGMETTIDTSNALVGNLAYVTNGAGRGILKNIIDGPSGVGRYLLEDGEMNGYPVYVTNAAPATVGAGSSGNLLVFGNWADLCIAQWGGYDITVDPYTIAHAGKVRIVINAYFDAKGLRGRVASGSGYDDYNVSFAKKAII